MQKYTKDKKMSPSQRFAKNIMAYCENRKDENIKNHCDVSAAIGLSRNYLNKVARGEARISLDIACSYADYLGLYLSGVIFDGDMKIED